MFYKKPPSVFDAPYKLLIEFRPAPEEEAGAIVEQYTTKFHRSLDQLAVNLQREHIYSEPWITIDTEDGEPVSRLKPPDLAEIILYLGSSGLAMAAYHLLKAWIGPYS